MAQAEKKKAFSGVGLFVSPRHGLGCNITSGIFRPMLCLQFILRIDVYTKGNRLHMYIEGNRLTIDVLGPSI